MDVELLTLTEAGRRVGLNRKTVRAIVAAGDLPIVTLPEGGRRIPAHALADWILRASQSGAPSTHTEGAP